MIRYLVLCACEANGGKSLGAGPTIDFNDRSACETGDRAQEFVRFCPLRRPKLILFIFLVCGVKDRLPPVETGEFHPSLLYLLELPFKVGLVGASVFHDNLSVSIPYSEQIGIQKFVYEYSFVRSKFRC
jgi:hypothetical protein